MRGEVRSDKARCKDLNRQPTDLSPVFYASHRVHPTSGDPPEARPFLSCFSNGTDNMVP